MASLTISEIDDTTVSRLRSRADRHGRSIEEEVRTILRNTLGTVHRNSGQRLLDTTRALFGSHNGVDLDLPPREPVREPPSFD